MIKKIKCLLGFHKEKWFFCNLPSGHQYVLIRCTRCDKYSLWKNINHYWVCYGKNKDWSISTYWTKDINDFPKEVVGYI